MQIKQWRHRTLDRDRRVDETDQRRRNSDKVRGATVRGTRVPSHVGAETSTYNENGLPNAV